METLTATEVSATFKRLRNFFEKSIGASLFHNLEVTTPEYDLSRQIADRASSIRKVNFFLFSERQLSDRFQSLDGDNVSGVPATFSIWDIARRHRQSSSKGQKESLDLDFVNVSGGGLPCLPAHSDTEDYQSYLVVMPGETLSALYEKYGSRLLEQNVRSFLQARGNVNKGIRNTIMNEPEMFFAYNNGITATAQEIEIANTQDGARIQRIKDLQIVNGGQTTASLFHTKRKDRVSLKSVFVQMKLSVIDQKKSEEVVPKISEYANTQNRVNAADFFSNHPFHIRMEGFSRRFWAPAKQGEQRETKWFYERARGQYSDAQSNMTTAEKKRFKAEYPKPQMFIKTDLAKFENVWDDNPRTVNLGAQKNFAAYATRIGGEWGKDSDAFNEYYFKRAISRAIIFRSTEKLVSAAPWYNGAYRANAVAYGIAILNLCCKEASKTVDFINIWKEQSLSSPLLEALSISTEFVYNDFSDPPAGFFNIGEWCKKEGCWQRLAKQSGSLSKKLPANFWKETISLDELQSAQKTAAKIQKVDNGIAAQLEVVGVPTKSWKQIETEGQRRRLLSKKEFDLLQLAKRMPSKLPTEKQSLSLLELLKKARDEGIQVD